MAIVFKKRFSLVYFYCFSQGFPTLAWGDASAAENYGGMRDYESLKEFADAHITKPVCSISNMDVCTDEEKKDIAAAEAKTDEELQAVAATITNLVKAEEKKLDKLIDELQDRFQEIEDAHNDAIAKT